MAAKEDASLAAPTNLTVGEFLDRHLEAAKQTLKRRTWEGHEETVRVHLVPTLGHVKLKELSRDRVKALYSAKRAEGLPRVP